jgi:hypothetical protein
MEEKDMRKELVFCIFLGLIFIFYFVIVQPSIAKVTIEVLSPRGEVEPPKAVGISPRLDDLAGKTIGLYDIGKDGFAAYLDVTEQLFKQRYPTTTIKRYKGAFDIGESLASKIAEEVDAVIYGSGD